AERMPEEPVWFERRARARAELGQWKSASQDYLKAIELGRRESDLWNEYALAALCANDVTGFREFCAGCIKRHESTGDPEIMDRLSALGRYGTPKVGDLTALGRLAAKAVETNPKSPWTWLTHGAIQYRQGKIAEAYEGLSKAVRNRGANEDPRDQFLLSVVLKRQGKSAEARAKLDHGVQLSEPYTRDNVHWT